MTTIPTAIHQYACEQQDNRQMSHARAITLAREWELGFIRNNQSDRRDLIDNADAWFGENFRTNGELG